MTSVHIQLKPFALQFRFPFRIAHGVRTATDVVYVKAMYGDKAGYGEATLPPYLADTTKSIMDFFANMDPVLLQWPQHQQLVMEKLNAQSDGHMPAKAALDMALWNLKAAVEGVPLRELIGVKSDVAIPHTYTIGVCGTDEMKLKIEHGLQSGFTFFKLKMDGMDDEKILADYLSLCKHPFAVDVNQGWSDIDEAIDFSLRLEDAGCILIEQPFHKSDLTLSAILKSEISIPLIADEACQRLTDIEGLQHSFSGINIKLQKCGGITEALQMINKARLLNLKILIGCMSESSVGCHAAEALAPLCDWADLDGPFLINNDPDMQHVFA